MKHTPGPWITGAWTAHGQMIRGANDEYVGYTQGYPNPNQKLREVGMAEAEANGRLIAAAPELLEALVVAKEALKTTTTAFPATFRIIDAAIRKAKGE